MLEHHFEDLANNPDGGSILTHQLQTIIDRLNDFIGDNQDNVSTISTTVINHETRITVIEDGPTDINDFTNEKIWTPINLDPSIMSMAFTSGGINLWGLKEKGNPLSEDLFAGLFSRFKVYPNNETGLLSVKVYFDNYVAPTDIKAAGSGLFIFGIILAPNHPGFLTAGDSGVVGGFGRFTNSTECDFILTEYNNRNYFQTFFQNSTDFTVADGANFNIEMNFGARTLIVGTTRSWGLLNMKISGDNGISPETLTVTGSDTSNPYSALAAMTGLRVGLGLWPIHNSNVGAARLKRFEIGNGYALL